MVEDYKGGRAETPPEIEHQFELIRNLCEVLHIPVLGVQNFEADDVLATLATWGRNESIPVVVVTGDRDAFQLVEDPFVKVLYNRRGVSDYSLYDEAGIFERCGIESSRYPLLAALRGDTSDNLPGVPGRGGEDRGEAVRPVPRHGRPLRPPRRPDAQAPREPRHLRRARAQQREGHDAHPRRAAGLHVARHHPRWLEPLGDRRLLRPLRDESDAHALRSTHERGTARAKRAPCRRRSTKRPRRRRPRPPRR